MAVIVDTDVTSFFLKEDSRAELYRPHLFGNPIGTADAWVASVALMFDIPLVTHNRRHFENIKHLRVISES